MTFLDKLFLNAFKEPLVEEFRPRRRFAQGVIPADMLVIDASPSMEEQDYPPNRFRAAKQAAIGFAERCAEHYPEGLIGVVFFYYDATVALPLIPVRAHLPALRDAITSARTEHSTNISAGLREAGREFDRAGGNIHPRTILLTDGHANCGPDPVETAGRIKSAGVQLDIVGIGAREAVDELRLRQMASIVNGERRYWFIGDSFELVERFRTLALREMR